MVFGIVALAALLGAFLIPNIVAIVLSIIGANKIHKESVKGKAFAITGLILGLISMMIGLSVWFSGIGFLISLLVAGISIPLFIIKLKPRAK